MAMDPAAMGGGPPGGGGGPGGPPGGGGAPQGPDPMSMMLMAAMAKKHQTKGKSGRPRKRGKKKKH